MTTQRAAGHARLFLARIYEALDGGCPMRWEDVMSLVEFYGFGLSRLREQLGSSDSKIRATAALEVIFWGLRIKRGERGRFIRLFRVGDAWDIWKDWAHEEYSNLSLGTLENSDDHRS